VQAYAWLATAAANGSEEADELRLELARSMSAPQLIDAKQAATALQLQLQLLHCNQ
jgi:predicted nucleic acid-binding protein